MTIANVTSVDDFRRDALPRIADALAVLVAASLPWSTSATGILTVLWFLATLPTLSLEALRREVMSAPGGLPVLLALFAALGMSVYLSMLSSARMRAAASSAAFFPVSDSSIEIF